MRQGTEDCTQLRGKVCLVTGANSGIGKATALGLARLGAKVVLACRDARRGTEAQDEIAGRVPGSDLELWLVDLSSQASIRDFAERFLADHTKLHVLVNNAGGWHHKRAESTDGIELTWATNTLGYFLLTQLLLERLRGSAPARIINVASTMAGKLELDDVEFRCRSYKGINSYSQSKQANQMLTFALARRLEGSGVTAHVVHPGGVRTPIYKKGGGVLATLFSGVIGAVARTPERGADTIIWLAACPEAGEVSGRFWFDRHEIGSPFRDQANEEKLWQLCERMTKG